MKKLVLVMKIGVYDCPDEEHEGDSLHPQSFAINDFRSMSAEAFETKHILGDQFSTMVAESSIAFASEFKRRFLEDGDDHPTG